MNIKNYIILAILFITVLLGNKLFWRNNKRHYNVIFIQISICLAYTFNINYDEYFMNEQFYLAISMASFALLIVVLLTLNSKSLKITLDNIILLIIFISLFISYEQGKIFDIVKFTQICVLYISIFLIGYMYKNMYIFNHEKILEFFSYMSIFNLLLGIMQFITSKKLLPGVFDESIIYTEGVTAVKRIVGLAGTNNAGGNLGAILFSIVLFNYLKTRKKIHLFALVADCIFTMLTLTRIGYLAVIIQVIIFFTISDWSRVTKIIKKLSTLIIGLFSFGIVMAIWGAKIYDILFLKRGDTTSSRLIQYSKAFETMISNNSIFSGIGAGQYKYYMYYIIGYWDIDIHSQYINVLVEQGVGIFILFIIFNIYILRKAYDKCDTILEKSFVISLFIGNLICCNFNPNQYYLTNNLLYYLLMYCYVYKYKKII